MCISVPARIIAFNGKSAEVEVAAARKTVFLAFDEEAHEGDWVLVHGTIALHLLDREAAKETIEMLQMLEKPDA